MLNTNNAFVAGQQDADDPHVLLGEVPSSLSAQDAHCLGDTFVPSVSVDSDTVDTDNELLGTESRQSLLEPCSNLETIMHDVSMADESTPLPGETGPSNGVPAPSSDMLLSLVTNWPCLVCTILGFYVAKQQAEGEVPSNEAAPARQLCPVHLLDGFTADLVLSADRATVFALVTTIVERMNACLDTPGCPQVDTLSFSADGLRLLTKGNQALFVGKRFLGSVVRVLALEHSRVKNTFSEMREMGSAGASGGGGGVASGSQGTTRVGGATVLETLRLVEGCGLVVGGA